MAQKVFVRSTHYLSSVTFTIICIAGTECGVHGAVSEYITVLSATELATCNAQNASLSGQCPPKSEIAPTNDCF